MTKTDAMALRALDCEIAVRESELETLRRARNVLVPGSYDPRTDDMSAPDGGDTEEEPSERSAEP